MTEDRASEISDDLMPGDKVLAKIRGYSPWPARIESIVHETNRKKYQVLFYGTYQTCICVEGDLVLYEDNKTKVKRNSRVKSYVDALTQIEDPSFSFPSQDSSHHAFDSRHVNGNKDGDHLQPRTNAKTKKQKLLKRKSGSSSGTDQKKNRVEHAVAVESFQKITEDNKEKHKSCITVPRRVKHVYKVNKKKKEVKYSCTRLRAKNKIQELKKNKVKKKGKKIKTENVTAASPPPHFNEIVPEKVRKLQRVVESGELVPSSLQGLLNDYGANKYGTEEVVALINEDKRKWQEVEKRVLFLERCIRSELSLLKANPEKCLPLLDELLGANIDALMLKKNPKLVHTVQRLCRYVGNGKHWNLSKEEEAKFTEDASEIRNRATILFKKFEQLFETSTGQTFWQVYTQKVKEYKEVKGNRFLLQLCGKISKVLRNGEVLGKQKEKPQKNL